jgi:hypothetical protein
MIEGGPTFRSQIEHILTSLVKGLPEGTTWTERAAPGGTAPLIQFAGIPKDTLLTLKSANGSTIRVRQQALAAAVSYAALSWLLWNRYYAGDLAAAQAARKDSELLARHVLEEVATHLKRPPRSRSVPTSSLSSPMLHRRVPLLHAATTDHGYPRVVWFVDSHPAGSSRRFFCA